MAVAVSVSVSCRAGARGVVVVLVVVVCVWGGGGWQVGMVYVVCQLTYMDAFEQRWKKSVLPMSCSAPHLMHRLDTFASVMACAVVCGSCSGDSPVCPSPANQVCGLNFFITDPGFEACFGWDPPPPKELGSYPPKTSALSRTNIRYPLVHDRALTCLGRIDSKNTPQIHILFASYFRRGGAML